MEIKNNKNIHSIYAENQLTIGLPNAMLYKRYETLWENFFMALGANIIVSEPTNKEIIHSGTEAAIDETCLSAKIYLGHVHSLIRKCDYILVPRISNWALNRHMCSRFKSQYDLVCNIFRGSGQKFISYDLDEARNLTEEKAFLNMGLELGFPKKLIKEAYKKAKKQETADWKYRLKSQEQLYKSEGLKVIIAAHSYVIEDEYFGKPVTDYLKELDVIPLRADITDRKEALKQSLKISKTLVWEFNREILGSLHMHREHVDGIILISAFPCGPDSMVNDIIARKFSELPVLNLVLDSQSGTAGMETRLESFVDILKFKKGIL
ncbi:MAG: hypothetical protein HFE90_09140 [Firmicutes bacterium]|nr:hypothetical protein [Bacillota bacterium]